MNRPAYAAAVVVAAASVATAVVAGAGGAARATPPATSGPIAFQRYLLQDHPLQANVAVANADGSGDRVITHAPKGFIDGEPEWSPDGRGIVFQRGPSVDGPWTLWTVSADGSGASRLSPRHGRCLDESSPTFSPDGTQIAFECHDHTSRGEIFSIVVMGSDGHNRRVVVRGTAAAGFGRPQFSPDGKRLVLDRQNIHARPKNGHATYVVNLDGTGAHRVTPWRLRAGDHPDWSPGGRLILVRSRANGPDFYRQGDLYTVHPDGSGLRRLTRFGPHVGLLQNGSFSPDGTAIVFATTKNAAGRPHLPDVFTMHVDGSRIRPVTRTVNWDGSPDWGPSG
jgi:Tol biopolymer transport system component